MKEVGSSIYRLQVLLGSDIKSPESLLDFSFGFVSNSCCMGGYTISKTQPYTRRFFKRGALNFRPDSDSEFGYSFAWPKFSVTASLSQAQQFQQQYCRERRILDYSRMTLIQ